MRVTELAVDMTMDRAGMPSGDLGSLSVGERKVRCVKKKTSRLF